MSVGSYAELEGLEDQIQMGLATDSGSLATGESLQRTAVSLDLSRARLREGQLMDDVSDQCFAKLIEYARALPRVERDPETVLELVRRCASIGNGLEGAIRHQFGERQSLLDKDYKKNLARLKENHCFRYSGGAGRGGLGATAADQHEFQQLSSALAGIKEESEGIAQLIEAIRSLESRAKIAIDNRDRSLRRSIVEALARFKLGEAEAIARAHSAVFSWEAYEAFVIAWCREQVAKTLSAISGASTGPSGVVRFDSADYISFGPGQMPRPKRLSQIPRIALRAGTGNLSEVLPDYKSATEAYIAVSRYAREQQKLRGEWARQLDVLLTQARSAKLPTVRMSERLYAKDYALCAAWAGAAEESIPAALIQRIGETEAARLFSARAAERSAERYCRQLANDVYDVSLTQLGHVADDWKTHDLLVDGRPVDVKSARQSRSSPDAYSEHCVPRFKMARGTSDGSREHVSIFGVMSSNHEPRNTARGEPIDAIALGEVRADDIHRLIAWTQSEFRGDLCLASLAGARLIPGWLFDYSEQHYGECLVALEQLSGLVAQATAANYRVARSWDGYWLMLSRGAGLNLAPPALSSPLVTEFLSALRSAGESIGLSRRALYCSVLRTMLRAVRDGQQSEIAVELREIIFGRVAIHKERPLLLHDPKLYIWNVISLFEEAGPGIREDISDARFFEMTHPNILRAVDNVGRRKTIYAYCGGRIGVGAFRRSCGYIPLVLGRAQLCANPSCGKLVCPDCGYCDARCEEGQYRQEKRHATGTIGGYASSPR